MVPTPLIVCVVDDDAGVRNALKFALEVEGFAVRTYAGAPGLLDDPELPSCRCLVVDFRMPTMDGLELAQTLAARGMTVPMIMITGRITRDLEARASKLGIHRLIEKPLADGDLLNAVQSALADGRPA
jgi:FixJ family two-component response regulator